MRRLTVSVRTASSCCLEVTQATTSCQLARKWIVAIESVSLETPASRLLMAKMMSGAKAKIAGFIVTTVAYILFGLLIAGCAHHKEFSGAEQRILATPPAFLTGPMALLLTNADSYNAQIVFQTP